jgi:hypothetical protein
VLLDFFNEHKNLTSLVIAGTGLTGAFRPVCSNSPALSKLVTLHIIDTQLFGWLPDCIWDIESVVILNTKIWGKVENPKAGAKIRQFEFRAVRLVPGPAVQPLLHHFCDQAFANDGVV